MQPVRYKVVFSGVLFPGKKARQVKRELARLLEMDIAQVELLFSSPGPIIRQSLDLATALSYAKIFEEAGAICHISALKPGTEELDESVAAQPVEMPRQKTISVLKADPVPAEAQFATFSVPRLTGWEAGIDVNRKDKSRFAYEDIRLVSVFANMEENEKRFSTLVFFKESRRGYLMDASKIVFLDFPDVKEQMLLSSLRRFIAYLLEKNPEIILDQRTFDFLQGSLPTLIKQDASCLATALGRLLDNPDSLHVEQKEIEPPEPPAPSDPQSGRPPGGGSGPEKKKVKPLVEGLWKEEPHRIGNEWLGPTIEMILAHQPSAPIRLRLLAGLLTLLTAASLWLVLFIPIDLFFTRDFGISIMEARQQGAPVFLMMRAVLICAAFLVLFFAVVLQNKPTGQTWGQHLTGIRVINRDGSPASGLDVWAKRFIGYLLLCASLGLLWFAALRSPEKISVADRISGTREVLLKDRPSIVWKLIPIAVFSTLLNTVFSYREIWASIPDGFIIWAGGVLVWLGGFFGYRAWKKSIASTKT